MPTIPGRKLDKDALKIRWDNLQRLRAQVEGLRAQAIAQREALERDVEAAGLGSALSELDHPAPPPPPEPEEPKVKVRLLDSIAHVYRNRHIGGIRGDVVLWPESFADGVVGVGKAERVGAEVPLGRVPRETPW